MRKLLIVAGALALALTACRSEAADLNKPKDLTPEQIMALPDPSKATCYVETSVAGTFLRNTREAQAGVGGGCDVRSSNIIMGAGVRADLADWRNTGTLFLKFGLAVNAAANLYSTVGAKFDDWKVGKTGQFMIGGGAEMKLEFLSPQLWGFAEAEFVASKWGSGITDSDVVTRLGGRWKF